MILKCNILTTKQKFVNLVKNYTRRKGFSAHETIQSLNLFLFIIYKMEIVME